MTPEREYVALLGKYADQPREQFIGKCVTLAFQSSKRGVAQEFLPVLVHATSGIDELVGDLMEQPAFATKWKKGDTITFWVEEIEDVREGGC